MYYQLAELLPFIYKIRHVDSLLEFPFDLKNAYDRAVYNIAVKMRRKAILRLCAVTELTEPEIIWLYKKR